MADAKEYHRDLLDKFCWENYLCLQERSQAKLSVSIDKTSYKSDFGMRKTKKFEILSYQIM